MTEPAAGDHGEFLILAKNGNFYMIPVAVYGCSLLLHYIISMLLLLLFLFL